MNGIFIKLIICIKHWWLNLFSAFNIGCDFSSVCPEDPLSAVEMDQASFSWKQSEEHDSVSVPDDKTADGSPPRSFYLHALNLSIKRVCAAAGAICHSFVLKWTIKRLTVSPWLTYIYLSPLKFVFSCLQIFCHQFEYWKIVYICKCFWFLALGLSGGCGGKGWLWEKFPVGRHNRRAYQVLIYITCITLRFKGNLKCIYINILKCRVC